MGANYPYNPNSSSSPPASSSSSAGNCASPSSNNGPPADNTCHQGASHDGCSDHQAVLVTADAGASSHSLDVSIDVTAGYQYDFATSAHLAVDLSHDCHG